MNVGYTYITQVIAEVVADIVLYGMELKYKTETSNNKSTKSLVLYIDDVLQNPGKSIPTTLLLWDYKLEIIHIL